MIPLTKYLLFFYLHLTVPVYLYREVWVCLQTGRGVVMDVPDWAIRSMYCSPALSSVLFPTVRMPAAWFREPCRTWRSQLCRRCSSSFHLPGARMPAAASPVTVPPEGLPLERHSNTERRQERDGCLQHSDMLWASEVTWDSSNIMTSTRTFCRIKEISLHPYELMQWPEFKL